jgi:RNA polymerase sigma-70 factor, ECF subfamily
VTVTIEGVKRKPAVVQPGSGIPSSEIPKINLDTSQKKAENSFDILFSEHWSRVCAVLYRLVGDRDEAEDLALEAFWRLYRRPPKDLNLGGWLYRVATNLGLNALRSGKRRKRYEEEAGFLELTQNPPVDPSAEAERAEQRTVVRQILAAMNPRSAQILVLRHTGLTYNEIAVALGLAASSIGTLLARAEQDFEKRFQKIERR